MGTTETGAIFDAIEAGDIAAFRELFADGTALRRNTDDAEVPVETVAEQLGMLHAVAETLTYSERESFAIPSGFITQQVLRVTFPSGTVVRMPSIVRFYLDEEGRIRQMEEWCDSAQSHVIEREMIAFASENA